MASIDEVIDDCATVLGQAEDLLNQAAGATGDKASALRAELGALLQAARARLNAIEGDAVDHVKAVARASDDYVHAQPWQAVGLAAALGFVLGALIARR